LQQLGSLLRPDAENLDPAYFARIAAWEQPSNRQVSLIRHLLDERFMLLHCIAEV
jgi:hypothetical protein